MFKLSNAAGYVIPIENRRTRGDEKVKFNIRNFNLKTMQKSPMYKGVWEWDDLGSDTQKAITKVKSKYLIKNKKPRVGLLLI